MLIILIFTSWIIAAICNAVMDVLAFKYKHSIFSSRNSYYWNPSISWRNKYKNKKVSSGSAFFGSTTFLVFTTDAWHLFQFLSNSFIIISMILLVIVSYEFEHWYYYVSLFIPFKVIWGVTFELFYSTIFRNKKNK
jgi:hypothetical protein